MSQSEFEQLGKTRDRLPPPIVRISPEPAKPNKLVVTKPPKSVRRKRK